MTSEKKAQEALAEKFAQQWADTQSFTSAIERVNAVANHRANTLRVCAEIEAEARGDFSARDLRLAQEDAAIRADAERRADEILAERYVGATEAQREKFRTNFIEGFTESRLGFNGRLARILAAPEARCRREAALNIGLHTTFSISTARAVLATLPERRDTAHVRLAVSNS